MMRTDCFTPSFSEGGTCDNTMGFISEGEKLKAYCIFFGQSYNYKVHCSVRTFGISSVYQHIANCRRKGGT